MSCQVLTERELIRVVARTGMSRSSVMVTTARSSSMEELENRFMGPTFFPEDDTGDQKNDRHSASSRQNGIIRVSRRTQFSTAAKNPVKTEL